MTRFHGVFSPICTPFTPDGELVDEVKIGPLVDFQLGNGIHGIISCGGTGEFTTLTVDERKRVTELTIEAVNGRAPVVPHTGACSTQEVIDLSRHAERAGADALMIVPPYYAPPTPDEIVRHYSMIADAVSLPIMVYNIPQESNVNFDTGLLSRLAEIDSVTMLKDSTGNMVQLQEIITELGDQLIIFNGADTLFYPSLVMGAQGAVWGGANPTPRACVELYELVVEQHDFIAAGELWAKLYPINRFYETEGFTASVKAASRLVGMDIGGPRAPFNPLSDAKVDELRSLLEPIGVLA